MQKWDYLNTLTKRELISLELKEFISVKTTLQKSSYIAFVNGLNRFSNCTFYNSFYICLTEKIQHSSIVHCARLRLHSVLLCVNAHLSRTHATRNWIPQWDPMNPMSFAGSRKRNASLDRCPGLLL